MLQLKYPHTGNWGTYYKIGVIKGQTLGCVNENYHLYYQLCRRVDSNIIGISFEL